MKIIARSLQRANVVVVSQEPVFMQFDAQKIMGLFEPKDMRGSTFVDDPAMRVRVLGFPEKKVKIILEERRLRIEEEHGESPDSSSFAKEAYRIISELCKGVRVESWGFNYDTFYRGDQVIPQRDIMANFVADSSIEEIKDFGWQFTLTRPHEHRQESHFFKVISPLEVAVHSNYHFNLEIPASADELQEKYVKFYSETERILGNLSF